MDNKKCFKCGLVKPLSKFYKHKQMADGHINKCIDCTKRDVRANYCKNIEHYRNYDKIRQRKSIHRILQHRYNSLRQRSEGRATHITSATGKDFLSKKEWDAWCKQTMPDFMRLYNIWVASGYDRKYCPSVDRINNNEGYTMNNIQWLSLVDNCRKHTKAIRSSIGGAR